jgi:hypothetical protein
MSQVPDPPLQRSDERTALAVVTSAFADDPVERWLYPDESYQREFPKFVRALGGKAIAANTASCSNDKSAVAPWASRTMRWSPTRACRTTPTRDRPWTRCSTACQPHAHRS